MRFFFPAMSSFLFPSVWWAGFSLSCLVCCGVLTDGFLFFKAACLLELMEDDGQSSRIEVSLSCVLLMLSHLLVSQTQSHVTVEFDIMRTSPIISMKEEMLFPSEVHRSEVTVLALAYSFTLTLTPSLTPTVNQSINQPINWSISQSIIPSANQSINQPANQSINRLVDRSIN